MSKPLVGRWEIDPTILNFLRSDTAVFANETHEGPVFKFPTGVPKPGDSVAVFYGFDVCKARGAAKHRPRVKVELRVKPWAGGEPTASLRIGTEAEGSPFRRFHLLNGFDLYADDGNPHAMCDTCDKRVPISHECQ